MAEWRKTGSRDWYLAAGDFQIHTLESSLLPGKYWFSVDDIISQEQHLTQLQATDAEAAKAEAVALFRAKLTKALEELEGL